MRNKTTKEIVVMEKIKSFVFPFRWLYSIPGALWVYGSFFSNFSKTDGIVAAIVIYGIVFLVPIITLEIVIHEKKRAKQRKQGVTATNSHKKMHIDNYGSARLVAKCADGKTKTGILGEEKYKKLEAEALAKLGFASWGIIPLYDAVVTVKSRQALDNYDILKFFREKREEIAKVERIVDRKCEVASILKSFLEDNEFKGNSQYSRLEKQINALLGNASAYRVRVLYISSVGNNLGERTLTLSPVKVKRIIQDPFTLMSKTEYNRYLREQQKEILEQKHHQFYERVNAIIDYANENKDNIIVNGGKAKVDRLIAQLFDRTVNSIKRIKSLDSEEWHIVDNFITHTMQEIEKVVGLNTKLLEYYNSPSFREIKETCEVLMSSQREFNEYISEKAQTISHLFGTRVVRNNTINEDEYAYIRPYKKTITPFTAEVSAAVFASAENNPLEYVVKSFYPNKALYPEQIQKLRLLIEELETLREAKQIIENYKAEYKKYLGDVPAFVLENDEAGFYSRLGFANIDESILTVEYKFVYTSGGGMAQRFFTIPMTEDVIVELIRVLESKLTASAFAKEQRMMMTSKLRAAIKQRDNFTCRICGNSTHAEPNLLLEIDHIIPVSKGGCTVEENLQTLCWKCNRAKSNKI